MKVTGMPFKAPLVRALLDGSKTQTRRALKRQPHEEWAPAAYGELHGFDKHGELTPDKVIGWGAFNEDGDLGYCCPYGQPGDRIWVRETFFAYGRWVTRYSEKKGRAEWHFIDMTVECDRAYQYDADSPDVPLAAGRGGALPGWYKRPSIFMPGAASRILLEIVSVRVERLNDCSDADARAEGTPGGHGVIPNYNYNATPSEHYSHLWESINGAGSWALNPWVWVIEFKRVEP
jgi:hypothetical protein